MMKRIWSVLALFLTLALNMGLAGVASAQQTITAGAWSTPQPLLGVYDTTSGELVGVNAGGPGQPAKMPVLPSVRGSVTVAGDSLIAFGDVTGANTQTAAGVLTGSGGKTSASVLAWADGFLGGSHFVLYANRGVGSTTIDTGSNSLIGATTPQLAAAFTDRSEVLWLHSGVNHLNPTIDPAAPTVAQIVQKMRRLLGVASPRKSRIVLEGVYPIGLNSAVNQYLRKSDIPLINAGFRQVCAQFSNCTFLDPVVLSTDGGATGDPKFYLADLLHVNTYGAMTLGQSYAQQLRNTLNVLPAYRPTKTVLLPEMAGTSGSAVPNNGVITGTVPGNMRVTIGTGSTSGWPKVALTTANNRLTLNIDNSGGLVAASVIVGFNSGTSYLGTLANGDTVIASCTINVSNPVLLKMHDLIFSQNFSGVGTLAAISAMAQSQQEISSGLVTFPPTSYGRLSLSTQPFTLNDTLASVNLQFSTLWGAGGSGTIDLGDLAYDAVTPF